jgi:hypothetical protein
VKCARIATNLTGTINLTDAECSGATRFSDMFSEVRHRPAPNVFVGTSDRGMRQAEEDG